MELAEEQQAPTAVEETVSSVEPDGLNGAEGDQQHGSAAGPTKNTKPQAGEEPVEEPWRKRLWFVRMPKPPEAAAVKPLEQEHETLRAQYNLMTEALNVKKVERDSAREATRAAREAFAQCRAAYDERAAPLKKLQEQRQDAAANANKLKASFSDLLVKSEAELDAQLAALHYRIEHESITLNEEKKSLATIKKLEQQRERVREYENSASLFAESRAKRSELQDVLKESEGELSALRQEIDVQRQILDKLREHERGIDHEVEEIISERRRCKELLDAAFHRMSGHKKAQWEKNNAFYTNRSFSREVRKLLAEGKLDESRAACTEQMDEGVARLAGDPSLRAEYFALWEQQRKTPVLLPSVDDVDADLPPPSKGAKKKGADAEPVDPTKKAEAAIAVLLKEAKEEARRAKAAAAAAASEQAASAAAAPATAVESGSDLQQGAEVVGLDVEAAAEVVGAPPGKAHAKPPKQAAPPSRPMVEPVVLPPENFELPEVVRMKEKTPSSQELKELERERNRQAQAEAERRKVKRATEKERRRQRQEQLAREAVAAATRAAEAAASAQVAAAAAARLAASNEADAAGASDTASSDGATAAASGSPAAQERGVGSSSSSGVEQRKKSSGGGKPAALLPVVKAMAPKPAARRPAGAKQAGLVKQAKKAAKEYSVPMVLGLVGVLALALVALFWTTSAVAPQ